MALALSAGAEAATPETAGSLTPLMPMFDTADTGIAEYSGDIVQEDAATYDASYNTNEDVAANERDVYNYLTGTMGMNSAAASGVMASMYRESRFYVDITNDYGTAYGLCQWYGDRWTNLQNYCNNNGLDWHTLYGQMRFLEYELNSLSSLRSYMYGISNDANGAYHAGYEWCRVYELGGNTSDTTRCDSRGTLARDTFWPKYQNGSTGGYTGWRSENGRDYWYENGVKQGTTGRGKEIYDPASDAWYWLDSVNNGAMAVSKDVYQDSNGGKWVRYDANGHMIKGWDTNSQGTYYFDLITGAMAKGTVVIDGITCVFDYNTGILQSTNVDVTKYREIKRTNYYADGSVMNTLTTDYDAQGRLLKEQRRDKSGNLQVQDDFYYEYNGMLTKHTHREYGNDNYSYEYRYEYDKSNRFAKISVYRYNGGWYLYSYWTAKEWDSLGSVSKFWEYNSQNKVTCIVNLTSSGSRNRYTKMTNVNSSNQTVRTDTWSYDSNGHLAGWTNSGNSNGYSNVLRLSSDNNIGAGNPLFDRHCGKFVTDDKITSASIKFQNDEVVEIRQNNQRISYTNQESMGMNSSNNLTRTFATYTDGGNFRYRTLVEYFKYKN